MGLYGSPYDYVIRSNNCYLMRGTNYQLPTSSGFDHRKACRRRQRLVKFVLTTVKRLEVLHRLGESVVTTTKRVRRYADNRRVGFEGRKACRESVMNIARLVEIKESPI